MPRLPARQSIDERLAAMVGPDGCALCLFRADAGRRYLDSLLWESVNDREVRARLSKGGGFCQAHAAMLVEADRRSTGGSLGAAILLAAGLRDRLRALGRIPTDSSRKATRSLVEARRPPDCPVCAQVVEAESHALDRLVLLCGQPQWAAALGGAGFCLADLAMVWSAAAATEPGLRTFAPVAAGQLDRLHGLLARLDGFIDHSSHDRRELMTDDERDSLSDATDALGGELRRR